MQPDRAAAVTDAGPGDGEHGNRLRQLLPVALSWWARTSLLLPASDAAQPGGGWVAVNRDVADDRRANAALAPWRCLDPVGWLTATLTRHRRTWPDEAHTVTRIWSAGSPVVAAPAGWTARTVTVASFTGLRHPPRANVSLRPCRHPVDVSMVGQVAASFEDRLALWRGTAASAVVSASWSPDGVLLRPWLSPAVEPSAVAALLTAAAGRWAGAGPVMLLTDRSHVTVPMLAAAGFSAVGRVWRVDRMGL